MRKRVITAAVGVVGLVVVGLGVASATVWRADDVLVATTTSSTQLVVTDPGVLEVGGDPATVTVTAPGGARVVLAVGRDYDVDGWVGQDAYTRVTGLASWDELATSAGEPAEPSAEPTSATAEPSSTGSPSATPSPSATTTATPTPTPTPTSRPTSTASATARPSPSTSATAGGTAADEKPVLSPDPTDSDMWFAQATGNGSAELVWPTETGRWSLLVASAGDTTPTLSIAWPRVVTTPWLWPCVVVGSLMALVSGLLLLRARAGARPGTWEPVHTGAVPVVTGETGGQPLTRRQLREAEQASRRTGQIPRVVTGAIRAVPAPAPEADERPRPADPRATGGPAGARTGGPETSGPTSEPTTSDPATTERAPGSAGAPAPSPRATPASPTAPVSRRALRGGAPTGQVPVVPPASSAASPASPGATSSSAPTAATPAVAPPSGPGAADDRSRHRPSWLGRSGPSDATTRPDPTPPTPSGRGTSSGPASSDAAPTGAATTGASPAGQSSSVQSSSVQSSSGQSPAGWTPAGQARPGGWVPGGPSAGPEAGSPHGGAPSWAHPPLPGAPAAAWSPGPAGGSPGGGSTRPDADEPTERPAADPSAGSRADAWRRAWGLPPTTPEPSDPAQGDDEGSER